MPASFHGVPSATAIERLDRGRDAVGVDDATGARPVAERGRRPGRRRGADHVPRRRPGGGRDRGAAAACRPATSVPSSCDRLGEDLEHRSWSRRAARRRGAAPDAGTRRRRAAERTTEREVAPQPSGWCGVLDLLALRTERDGGQALGLEDVGERTHGTRAQRSNGCEQHDVDAVLAQQPCRRPGRCRGAPRDRSNWLPAYDRCSVDDRADRAVGRQLVEPVEREHDVHVVAEPDGVEVRAPVAES